MSKDGGRETDDERMEISGSESDIMISKSGDLSNEEVVDEPGLAVSEISREQEYAQGKVKFPRLQCRT